MAVKRSTLITIVVVAVFGALLFYSTLSAQREECEVCVTFNGRSNCASATGATDAEAARSAQTTACGPIAQGMAESINCGDLIPSRKTCRHAA
jgi:hypothetical protein